MRLPTRLLQCRCFSSWCQHQNFSKTEMRKSTMYLARLILEIQQMVCAGESSARGTAAKHSCIWRAISWRIMRCRRPAPHACYGGNCFYARRTPSNFLSHHRIDDRSLCSQPFIPVSCMATAASATQCCAQTTIPVLCDLCGRSRAPMVSALHNSIQESM